MSHLEGLYQWPEMVVKQRPTLSKSQAVLLALWSFGMVWARSYGQTAVVVYLSRTLESSYRKRISEETTS